MDVQLDNFWPKLSNSWPAWGVGMGSSSAKLRDRRFVGTKVENS